MISDDVRMDNFVHGLNYVMKHGAISEEELPMELEELHFGENAFGFGDDWNTEPLEPTVSAQDVPSILDVIGQQDIVLKNARDCCQARLQEAMYQLVIVEKQLERLKSQLSTLIETKEADWIKDEFVEALHNKIKDVESQILMCSQQRQNLALEI